jgi:hypothetical protein
MWCRSLGLVLALMVTSACGPASTRDDDDDDGADGGPPGTPDAMQVCAPNASEACYNGPAGTLGVGTCIGGTRQCYPDGAGWGPCLGEVLPNNEVCANGQDEDCNGTADDIVDSDGDGYTSCTGDCCEDNTQCGAPASVNPGAAEAPTEPGGIAVDDDCDGATDEVEPPCDGAFAIDDADAMNAARAIGLCNFVTTAAWTRADGSPAAHGAWDGILNDFGPNVLPQEGAQMLALSSGYARDASDPGACGLLTCMTSGPSTAPPGFPQDVPSCPGGLNINDDATLTVHVRAPSNATGYSVDFAFYSFEYPEWVCTTYNDQFIIHVTPAPTGSINGNIAFDSAANPVSVNVGFFSVCAGCPDGTAALVGTGFDTWNDAGATVWLRSQAPVTAGQDVEIRFAIWDTGDQAFDSTVVIDNFQWILSGSPGVETNPIP